MDKLKDRIDEKTQISQDNGERMNYNHAQQDKLHR